MLKSGVKTLSIIDTISELATDSTEASRLTLPSPISIRTPTGRTPGAAGHPKTVIPPPRNPKVSVPLSTPPNQFRLFNGGSRGSGSGSGSGGGAKPRNSVNGFFASSSPIKQKTSLPPGAKLNFSSPPNGSGGGGVSATVNSPPPAKNGQIFEQQPHQQRRSFDRQQQEQHHMSLNLHHQSPNRGNGGNQTPDWIRDIFQYAKSGNLEKLVRLFCLKVYYNREQKRGFGI